LIFSKHELKRFPAETEIREIVEAVNTGVSLQEAKEKARANVPEPITFGEWLAHLLGLRQKPVK